MVVGVGFVQLSHNKWCVHRGLWMCWIVVEDMEFVQPHVHHHKHAATEHRKRRGCGQVLELVQPHDPRNHAIRMRSLWQRRGRVVVVDTGLFELPHNKQHVHGYRGCAAIVDEDTELVKPCVHHHKNTQPWNTASGVVVVEVVELV